MSTLNTNSWYRIYYTVSPFDTYCLVNGIPNGSGTGAGSAPVVITSCQNPWPYNVDQWQVVPTAKTSGGNQGYTIRSRNITNDGFISIFTSTEGLTLPRVDIGVDDTNVPQNSTWSMSLQANQNNAYLLYISLSSDSYYMRPEGNGSARLFMTPSKSLNLNTLGSFRFLVADTITSSITSSSARPTSSTSSSSTISTSFTQGSTTTQSSSQSSTSSPLPVQNNDGLTTAAKAGIAIGAIVGALLVVAAFIFVFKKRFTVSKRQKQTLPPPPQMYTDYTQAPPLKQGADQKYELSSQSQSHNLYNNHESSNFYELDGGQGQGRAYK